MLPILLDHALDLIMLLIIIFSILLIINSINQKINEKNIQHTYIEDIGRLQFEDDQDLKMHVGELKGKIPHYNPEGERKIVVLEFEGDTNASDIRHFSEEVTAAINFCKNDPQKCEVLIKINSGGGIVNGYGLLAAQIERFKKYKIKTTASVDLIAASGGYLGACAADRIIAAPFAYIGSIGVISSTFNYTEILKKIGVSFDEFTAGDSKSTVSPYREINTSQKEEYNRELETIHEAFIKHVCKNRQINTNNKEIFSGKHWLATKAINYKLVDEIKTSDEFISIQLEKGHRAYAIKTKLPKKEVGIINSMIKIASQKILNNQQFK